MKRKLLLIFLLALLLISCNKNPKIKEMKEGIVVHYIDVGQGDASLVSVNGKNLLIDSGPKDERDKLISFLNSEKIDKIHYVIATHPHEDHIGNMAYIIDKYKVEKFYAPKVQANSKSFELMTDSLKRNSLKINVLKEGSSTLSLGENTKISIFSPTKDYYDNLNNYSPLIKITYQDASFLFTGDAEKEVEQAVLSKNSENLKSTILKIGHHGSKTSSSKSFINSVEPKIAILSYSIDNSYGHPHKEVTSLLKEKNIKMLSTAENGTISLFSEGKQIYSYK